MSVHDKLVWLAGISCSILVVVCIASFIALVIGSNGNHEH